MDYKIVLLAHESIASTIIEVIRKSRVRLISMTPASEDPAETLQKPKAISRSMEVRRNYKSTRAALGILQKNGGWVSCDVVRNEMVAMGFAVNTASPALSTCFITGTAERRGRRGSYEYKAK